MELDDRFANFKIDWEAVKRRQLEHEEELQEEIKKVQEKFPHLFPHRVLNIASQRLNRRAQRYLKRLYREQRAAHEESQSHESS